MVALWQAVVGGVISGLVLAFMVGPVFFALLQANIEKGFLIGIMFAMGISLSDSTYFFLSYLGISQVKAGPVVHTVMGAAGGIFLLGFGLSLLLRKPKVKEPDPASIGRATLIRSFIKGFLLNTLNPSTLMYWIMVVGAASAHYHSDGRLIFAFFVSSISIVFSTDVLKSYLANKLKHMITPAFMLWLNRISGSLLLIAGGKLLWDVSKFLFGS